jgi:hypothetical protein
MSGCDLSSKEDKPLVVDEAECCAGLPAFRLIFENALNDTRR